MIRTRVELLKELESLCDKSDAVEAALFDLKAALADALVEARPLLGDCRQGNHLFSVGHCVKCGEPVDAYAAARKEAR